MKPASTLRFATPARTAFSIALITLVAAPQSAHAQIKVRVGEKQQTDAQILAQQMHASLTVAEQVLAISDDKDKWNAAQRKISPDFIYAARVAKGQEAAPGVPTLDTGLVPDEKGRVSAIIHSDVREPEVRSDLRAAIIKAGGEIVNDVQETMLVKFPHLHSQESLRSPLCITFNDFWQPVL